MQEIDISVIAILLDDHVLTWVPPLVLLAAAGYLLWPTLRRAYVRWALARLLRHLGPAHMDGALLEDAVGNLAYFEQLVLTPAGIVAVEVLRNRGVIFGAEGLDQWAQVVGRRTTRFDNPVTRSRERAYALRDNFPDVPVHGMVLFACLCEFPKGQPEGVATAAELRAQTPPELEAVPADLRAAWEQLERMSRDNRERFKADVKIIQGQRAYARPAIAAGALGLAIGWAIWRALTIGM